MTRGSRHEVCRRHKSQRYRDGVPAQADPRGRVQKRPTRRLAATAVGRRDYLRVGIEDDGYFHGRLGVGRGKAPLGNGLLRRYHQGCASADDLGLSHRAVGLDENFQAHRSANAPLLQRRGVLRFHLFQNFAAGLLRPNWQNTSQEQQAQEAPGLCALQVRSENHGTPHQVPESLQGPTGSETHTPNHLECLQTSSQRRAWPAENGVPEARKARCPKWL